MPIDKFRRCKPCYKKFFKKYDIDVMKEEKG